MNPPGGGGGIEGAPGDGFSAWRERVRSDPEGAAAEFRRRVAAVPEAERRAALSFLREPAELAAAFAGARGRSEAGGAREVGEMGAAGADAAAIPENPLAGVPYLHKDLYDVAGVPTTCSSVFLAEERPTPSESSALERDLAAAGAVFCGKTHMVEFAFGLEGFNAHHGNCPHPRFPELLSGGSSSGSAWAVGKGIVPLATGTDTAGSVRVPAAFCGVFGLRLRPREPWISEGAFPLAPTYDAAGWFTGRAGDMEATVRALLRPNLAAKVGGGLYFEDAGVPIEPDLKEAYRSLAERLGAGRSEPHEAVLSTVCQAAGETYAVLAGREAYEVHRDYFERYRDRYDPRVRARLELGAGRGREEILAARAHREEIADAFAGIFIDFDFLLAPIVHRPAAPAAEHDDAFRAHLLRLNTPVSLARLPALALPVPLPGGLSGGLQVVFRNAYSPVPVEMLRRCRA